MDLVANVVFSYVLLICGIWHSSVESIPINLVPHEQPLDFAIEGIKHDVEETDGIDIDQISAITVSPLRYGSEKTYSAEIWPLTGKAEYENHTLHLTQTTSKSKSETRESVSDWHFIENNALENDGRNSPSILIGNIEQMVSTVQSFHVKTTTDPLTTVIDDDTSSKSNSNPTDVKELEISRSITEELPSRSPENVTKYIDVAPEVVTSEDALVPNVATDTSLGSVSVAGEVTDHEDSDNTTFVLYDDYSDETDNHHSKEYGNLFDIKVVENVKEEKDFHEVAGDASEEEDNDNDDIDDDQISIALQNLPHDIPKDRTIAEVLAENTIKDKQFDELRIRELIHELMTHTLGFGEVYSDEPDYEMKGRNN